MSFKLIESSNGVYTLTGNTFQYKDEIKSNGGKWNGELKGWDFPSKEKADIALIKLHRSSGIEVSEHINGEQKINNSKCNIEKKYVLHTEYVSLLTRVEKLEQILAHNTKLLESNLQKDVNDKDIKNIVNMNKLSLKKSLKKIEEKTENDGDSSDDEVSGKVTKFMKTRKN